MNKYIEYIKKMDIKDDYKQTDLFIKELLYDQKDKIEIYYAPFDYINKDAKVMLLGITPGWTQMQNAYLDFVPNIKRENLESCFQSIKKVASFSGTLRKNLVNMLDEIKLNHYLNIDSCQQLFEDKNHLVHNTSILRYPVFVQYRNYTGSQPNMLKTELLRKMIHQLFIPELKQLDEDILIIPMGKAVSEVLVSLSQDHLIHNKNILYHFPHPSGANGSRKKQFEVHKDYFIEMINKMGK